MSIAHRILPRAEQQMRSLLSSSRIEEGAIGTRSDMRTKEEGRGRRREEKRRDCQRACGSYGRAQWWPVGRFCRAIATN